MKTIDQYIVHGCSVVVKYLGDNARTPTRYRWEITRVESHCGLAHTAEGHAYSADDARAMVAIVAAALAAADFFHRGEA